MWQFYCGCETALKVRSLAFLLEIEIGKKSKKEKNQMTIASLVNHSSGKKGNCIVVSENFSTKLHYIFFKHTKTILLFGVSYMWHVHYEVIFDLRHSCLFFILRYIWLNDKIPMHDEK